MYVCMYVRTYVCMYVCMYVFMYVCIYIYIWSLHKKDSCSGPKEIVHFGRCLNETEGHVIENMVFFASKNPSNLTNLSCQCLY
jgi:hypothetical protein